jgi:hypothetical protein
VAVAVEILPYQHKQLLIVQGRRREMDLPLQLEERDQRNKLGSSWE